MDQRYNQLTARKNTTYSLGNIKMVQLLLSNKKNLHAHLVVQNFQLKKSTIK